ncbi:hypothetical protein [uncultured Shewanella sp.]|uniref:hypothetical protein n=1 Tax=uncultured Shewanella sp. TaxID=173975 RepID=UPI0026175826|nr:hypothetical protein [uncultured Shewanella sp.]
MNNEVKQNMFLRYLSSRSALENIMVPIILYTVMFWCFGAGWAVISTAIYGVCVALIRKGENTLSVVLLLLFSGGCHYAFSKGFTPFGITQESVFLSVSSAVSMLVILSAYSLVNRPMIKGLAESGLPYLKTLPISETALYHRVWHEVSMVWIIAQAIKLLVVLIWAQEGNKSLDMIVFLFSWPYTVALIAFSVKWPKKRWQRAL